MVLTRQKKNHTTKKSRSHQRRTSKKHNSKRKTLRRKSRQGKTRGKKNRSYKGGAEGTLPFPPPAAPTRAPMSDPAIKTEPQKLETKLNTAAYKGDMNAVRRLFEQNNITRDMASFACWFAVQGGTQGHVDVVDMLLDQEFEEGKIDPDTSITTYIKEKKREEEQYPMLITAIEKESTKVVKKLLKKGANPNIQQLDDEPTPLFLAVAWEESPSTIPIVTLLLEHGADPQQPIVSENNQTPLSVAKEKGLTDIVSLMDGPEKVEQKYYLCRNCASAG